MIIPRQTINNMTSAKYAVPYAKAEELMEDVDKRAKYLLYFSHRDLNPRTDTVVLGNSTGIGQTQIINAFVKYEPNVVNLPPNYDDDIHILRRASYPRQTLLPYKESFWSVKDMKVREKGVLGALDSKTYSLTENSTTTVYKVSRFGLSHEVAIDNQSGDVTISHSFLGIKL